MTILDASAVLALLRNEPGADVVRDHLDQAWISAVNLAEVVGKVVDDGKDASGVRQRLDAAGTDVVPVTAADAELAGALRSVTGGRALSVADRCCLALAIRTRNRIVLTADRAWAELDLPISIRLVR